MKRRQWRLNNITENNMEKINVYLTLEEIQNTLIFLSRTDLSGKEVPAFNDIVGALHRATQQKED